MKSGQTAPRTTTTGLRQRAWWVMRRRQTFTLPELLSIVAEGQEKDAEGNLGRWLRQLANAGVLQRTRDRAPGAPLTSNGHYRYTMSRDFGRNAPVVRASTGVVYDPNNGETLPIEREADHA